MKEYKLGLVVGRFQIPHRGHQLLIQEALNHCKRVIILLGSSQESRTWKNPMTFEERKSAIYDSFDDDPRLEIYPIDDIGSGENAEWGKYVLDTLKKYCIDIPDVLFEGREQKYELWQMPMKIIQIDKHFELSSTIIKNAAKNGYKDFVEANLMTNCGLNYEKLCKLMKEVR